MESKRIVSLPSTGSYLTLLQVEELLVKARALGADNDAAVVTGGRFGEAGIEVAWVEK